MPAFHVQVLTIDGMHGPECIRRITHALSQVPAVRVHDVSVGQAKVLAEPALEAHIRTAIEHEGFSLQASRSEA